MPNLIKLLIPSLVLLLAPVALLADDPPLRFGPEFTFTNDDLIKKYWEIIEVEGSPKKELFEPKIAALGKRIEEACKKRAVGKCRFYIGQSIFGSDVYKLEYTDIEINGTKLEFEIGTDVEVIEVRSTPMTSAQWDQHKAMITSDLFDNAAALNLKPHATAGGGHINMDFAHFKNNPDLVVALITDIANHPELSMGAFGIIDLEDAQPFALLDKKHRRRFTRLVDSYWKREIDLRTFIERLNKEVYVRNRYKGQAVMPSRYQAVNLTNVMELGLDENDRIEFRPVAAQENVEEYVRQVKLLEKRVEYLREQLKKGRIVQYRDPGIRTHPFDTEDLARRLNNFLIETGLDPGEYAPTARRAWGSVADTILVPVGNGAGCATKPAKVIDAIVESL